MRRGAVVPNLHHDRQALGDGPLHNLGHEAQGPAEGHDHLAVGACGRHHLDAGPHEGKEQHGGGVVADAAHAQSGDLAHNLHRHLEEGDGHVEGLVRGDVKVGVGPLEAVPADGGKGILCKETVM